MSESLFGIALESLPGPKRGEYPASYFRDEAVPSPNGSCFALAYTIAEVSMGNDVGCVLWGELLDDEAKILGNPKGVHASCWYSPWAVWLDEETFLFKAQYYNGKTLHMPLVAVNVFKGCAVIPGTDNAKSRPGDIASVNVPFNELNAEGLLHEIGAAHNHSLQARRP